MRWTRSPLTSLYTFAYVFWAAVAANVRGGGRHGALPSRSNSSTSGIALARNQIVIARGAPQPDPIQSWGETQEMENSISSSAGRMELQHGRTAEGLFFVLFVLLVVVGYTVAVSAWESVYPERIRNARFVNADEKFYDLDRWKSLAENGELDIYTCFALSFGRYIWNKRSLRLIPKMCGVIIIQVGVALLFVRYVAGKGSGHFYSQEQSFTFRAVGTLLYAYSCWRMYESMFDECREWVVGMLAGTQAKSVSPRYVWPLVFGEVMNVSISSSMFLTLYYIFCQCAKPQDLLINCIAINFVIDIDNQIVEGDEVEEAFDDFSEALSEWKAADTESYPKTEIIRRYLPDCMRVVHFLVPMAGAYLAIFFLCAGDVNMCHGIRSTAVAPYASWPFCIGVQT